MVYMVLDMIQFYTFLDGGGVVSYGPGLGPGLSPGLGPRLGPCLGPGLGPGLGSGTGLEGFRRI